MSFLDLYISNNLLITNPNENADSSAIVYGIPFDSTHSFRPGTRFGPDAIRLAFNNIEIFSNRFNVDVDVWDPAFAPGMGNSEVLGITSRELFEMEYCNGR